VDLISVGCECDIYKLPGNFVYKHYHHAKIGYVLYGERNPTRFLMQFDEPYVEAVLDSNAEGFVTNYCPSRAGSFLFYDHTFDVDEVDLDRIASFLYDNGVSHNDITPANILLHDGHPMLIDWSKNGSEWDGFWRSDGLRIERWKQLLQTKSCRWFEEGCCDFWRPAVAAEIHSIVYANMSSWRTFDQQHLTELVKVKLDIDRIQKVYGFSVDLIDEAMALVVAFHIKYKDVWVDNFSMHDKMMEKVWPWEN